MSNKEKRKEKFGFLLNFLIVVLMLLYFVFSWSLFYMQCRGFSSDMHFYIAYIDEYLKGERSFAYPVFYVLSAWLSTVCSVYIAIPTVTASFHFCGVVILAYYTWKFVYDVRESCAVRKSVLIALSLHMISMLYFLFYRPPGIYWNYLGVFTPNPYHNATYMAAQPFMIGAFFSFYDLYTSRYEKIEFRKAAVFSIMLLLSTMTKPSFTLVFVQSAFIILCVELFCNLKYPKKINITNLLYIGLSFVPTVIDMVYQYWGLFTGTGKEAVAGGHPEANGAGFGIGFLWGWRLVCDNVPVAILLAAAFPFTAILVIRTLHRETMVRIGGITYLVGLTNFVFLYERGERFMDLNFAWGYMCGLFLLHTSCLLELMRQRQCMKLSPWRFRVCFSLYFLHLICGILYFILQFLGFGYV